MGKDAKFWWTIIATIIVGPVIQAFLQFIFQVLFIRHVDKEIAKLKKELDKREERKEKKLEGKIDKLSELLETETISLFKQIHIDNSKPKIYSGNSEWRLLSFSSEHKREHNNALEKMKEIFDTIALDLDDNDWSFVINCVHEQHYSKKERYEFLTWKEYKEFLQKSDNCFDYFDNLWKNRLNLKGCCHEVLFLIDKINYLCSKITSELIKKIDAPNKPIK